MSDFWQQGPLKNYIFSVKGYHSASVQLGSAKQLPAGGRGPEGRVPDGGVASIGHHNQGRVPHKHPRLNLQCMKRSFS